MDYQNLVRDFAIRTKHNLEVIRKINISGEYEVFEVTQLINSMLGLLVFPKEYYWNQITDIPLNDLKERGWPVPRVYGDSLQVSGLRELVRYLRNAIAHFRIEFVADDEGQIAGIRVNNINPRDHQQWQAELSIDDLEKITTKFIELIEN